MQRLHLYPLRKFLKPTQFPLVLRVLVRRVGSSRLRANQVEEVDFILLWSGPVCKVSEEDIYSKYTRDNDGSQVPSYEEALRSRTTPYVWPDWLGDDIDPHKSLGEITSPGLWIFGGKDGSVPVDLSISRLQSLIETGKSHYSYILFSEHGHNNIEPTFSAAIDWLKRVPR